MIDAMYDTDLQPARSLSGTRAQSRSGYNTTHHDPKKYFGSLSDDARPRDVLGGRATPRPIPTKTNTLHDPSLSPVRGEASSEGTPCLDNQACQSGWEILLPRIKGEARKKILRVIPTNRHSIWLIFWNSIWHPSGSLSDLQADSVSDMHSDTSSGIRPAILSIWHSIWYMFWIVLAFHRHFIWHSARYLFWHSFWHLRWHSGWQKYNISCGALSDIHPSFYLASSLAFHRTFSDSFSGVLTDKFLGIPSDTPRGILSGIHPAFYLPF